MRTRFSFESFGVELSVEIVGSASAPLLDAVEAILPPHRRAIPSSGGPRTSVALMVVSGRHTVVGADCQRHECAGEADAVHALDREIRAVVSLESPEGVFVHAGVVAGPDGACVIPGRSLAGKTTLVAALVAAGATYLSDEYAVLDRSGWVVPYARALSMRTLAGRRDVPAAELGAVAGLEPRPVSLVVHTSYDAHATFDPARGTEGDCGLALVANAVAARSRPADVLAAASAVSRRARYYRGPRGEAAPAAAALLDLLGLPADRPKPPSTPLIRRSP
jgi:hypothetical protein